MRAKRKKSKPRWLAQPKLQRAEVRRSAAVQLKCLDDIELKHQDAFKFLRKLRAKSANLIISSPPYCMGKEYDKSQKIEDFIAAHEKLAPLLVRILRPGGSLCWQVGHHVNKGIVIPLDAIVYQIFSKQPALQLRNRIIWSFGHGAHARQRFSGRHETILWFTKGSNYRFDLNAVRIPQKYPGKKHYKGPKKGKFSGNPRGKNPSDVWEIPNVKSKHIEKTKHPCQFPVSLVQRLIRALTRKRGLVVDPFMGSGSSALAAALEGRRFMGSELKSAYVTIAKRRLREYAQGFPKYRRLEQPIYRPSANDAVAKRPPHFLNSD
jgi:adenine-specific DNA-methyltransferase